MSSTRLVTWAKPTQRRQSAAPPALPTPQVCNGANALAGHFDWTVLLAFAAAFSMALAVTRSVAAVGPVGVQAPRHLACKSPQMFRSRR